MEQYRRVIFGDFFRRSPIRYQLIPILLPNVTFGLRRNKFQFIAAKAFIYYFQ